MTIQCKYEVSIEDLYFSTSVQTQLYQLILDHQFAHYNRQPIVVYSLTYARV